MKKLIIVLLFFPFTCFAQELNDDGTITKVVNVEMSADDIYAKLNEWVAETYNSAEAVTQLNSKSKIITKGNSTLTLKINAKNIYDYRIKHTLSISIRDKKYKMDLSLGEITSSAGFTYKLSEYAGQGLVYGKKLTKDQYQEHLKNELSKIHTGKKLQKRIQKIAVDDLDDRYSAYEHNCLSIDEMVNSFFNGIENKVKAEDDW